jgi:hypothetical protein
VVVLLRASTWLSREDKAVDDELVRKAAIRHYFAMVALVVESARQLEASGIGSGEAIDEAIAALPLEQVSALLISLVQAHDDLDRTAHDIEAYQLAGKPYGNTYGELMRWAVEQVGESREVQHAAEKATAREEDEATEEAEERAANEGMIDRATDVDLESE